MHFLFQKHLLNQEINKKQKVAKLLQQKFIGLKNSLNCKIGYIDYVHVCNTFLVCNNKNISQVKEKKKKNYATFFLEIWVIILTHIKILIKLDLVF